MTRRVVLVPLTGLRLQDPELQALGMQLPGLQARAGAVAGLPSLAMLTLAALTPAEWQVDYLPVAQVDDALCDKVQQLRPDLVAVSCLTASAPDAYALAAGLRRRGLRSVLGGLHATACPAEAALHFDAVVLGDGEPVWRQVLEDAAAGALQTHYRVGPFALRDAPVPRFDLIAETPPRFTLQTQRGCPLACEFCAASRKLGPFRVKPLANIEAELTAIRALDPRPRIELADDNTFLRGHDAPELCDLLRTSGARWFTEADWRVGERPSVLQHLRGAGCAQILVGLESLAFRYPGMGAKQAELSRMVEACLAIQEAGVPVNACFIVGGDGETEQSLEKLTAFLWEAPFAEVQVTLETPFPGTALEQR